VRVLPKKRRALPLPLYGTFGHKRTRDFIGSWGSIDTSRQKFHFGTFGWSRNCICVWLTIYVYTWESSWNPNSNALEPDRPLRHSPTTSVIAQQYSFATFDSWRFLSNKEKFGVHVIIWVYFIYYYYFLLLSLFSIISWVWNCGSLSWIRKKYFAAWSFLKCMLFCDIVDQSVFILKT